MGSVRPPARSAGRGRCALALTHINSVRVDTAYRRSDLLELRSSANGRPERDGGVALRGFVDVVAADSERWIANPAQFRSECSRTFRQTATAVVAAGPVIHLVKGGVSPERCASRSVKPLRGLLQFVPALRDAQRGRW